MFTAVLYLDEEEAEDRPPLRSGGETGIADELRRGADGTVDLLRGLIVEPRHGRLLLFSGGAENYHAPLKVTRGEAPRFHVWFHCPGVRNYPVINK